MGHIHPVYDTDTHFTIDAVTRAIKKDANRKTSLVQGDHNSERITFECPRYIEGHDMSLCNVVEVHFFNIDTKTKEQHKDYYTVDDLQVNPKDENTVICSWLISKGATQFKGILNFLVRFKCVEAGIVMYVWNTNFFTGITVAEGSDAGHGTLGILLFVISAGKVGIQWDIVTILYYVSAIIGGVLIQGGIFIFFSSLCFYFVETNSIRDIFYWNMRKFAGYPISIYSKAIQIIMIYVVPFAFVNYFPAQFLLRKEDMALYNDVYMYIAPLVGVVIYILAYIFWRISVKRYTSTGN